jgi:hypothetical protein
MSALAPLAGSDLVLDPDGVFERNYNRLNFMFAHELAGHPMWELPNLIALSRRMPDHTDTYWSNGKIAVGNNWEYRQNEKLSLDETIVNIEHNNSMVMLKHTEQDPEYGPVLQKVLARMVALSGERMRSDVTVGEVLILISSPNRITPYHMDGEANFLLQVAGDKQFYVFDHTDRSLVTDLDLEKFYAVSMVLATYQPERQADATAYDLHAGYGIHVPVNAPHWVQNHDNISVALSVTYELRSVDRLTELHRFNRKLRKIGFSPSPPGQSEWRDGVKLAAARGLRAAVRTMRKRPQLPRPYAVWTPPAA